MNLTSLDLNPHCVCKKMELSKLPPPNAILIPYAIRRQQTDLR